MSEFYSPWQDAGGATQQIAQSLQRLTMTLAQKQMQQRFQAAQLAMRQQQINNELALQHAQIGQHNAAAGLDTSRMQHQQAVDSAARGYQQAVVARSDGPNFMMNGPTQEDAQQAALSRELGMRAVVRALGGQVDNPPTATVNPGQERINTMTGNVLGYLQPNPTFHSVPAGGTPYVLGGDGQAMQQGQQTGFRPQSTRAFAPQFHPGSQYGAPAIFDPNSMSYIPVNEGSSTNAPSFGTPLRYTNNLSSAVSAGAQQQAPTKIRVRGPNGQTGTMDSTEELPTGWQVIQ